MKRGPHDHGTESRRRAGQFMVLAATLWVIAAVLHLLDIELWPAWVTGTGLFVCSQAWLKWQDSRRYRRMSKERAADKAREAAAPEDGQNTAQ
jgi:hypothetical protein